MSAHITLWDHEMKSSCWRPLGPLGLEGDKDISINSSDILCLPDISDTSVSATSKDKWRLYLTDSIHIGLTWKIVLSTKKAVYPSPSPSPGAGAVAAGTNHKQDLDPCGAWLGWLGWGGMLNNCFHWEAISNYDPLIDSVSCLRTIILSTKRWDNVVTSYKSEHCLTHY